MNAKNPEQPEQKKPLLNEQGNITETGREKFEELKKIRDKTFEKWKQNIKHGSFKFAQHTGNLAKELEKKYPDCTKKTLLYHLLIGSDLQLEGRYEQFDLKDGKIENIIKNLENDLEEELKKAA